MASDDASENLLDMIERIEENTEGERVSVGELVEALGQRSFGSLFSLTALLAILPTGAIPGMSILTGTIMLILSVQLLFGQSNVWLPGFIKDRSMPRERLLKSLRKAKGPAQTLGKVVGPRLSALLRPPFLQLVAIAGIIVSLSMYPLAVVPFGAFPAGVSLLVIGLGLTVRDGLLIALGILIGVVGLAVAYFFFPL